MITLRRGREYAWLDDAIEHLLRLLHCRLIELIFRSSETRRKTDGLIKQKNSRLEIYYTRSRIERLVAGIIAISILALLVAPIYILYQLTSTDRSSHTTAISVGTLLVFTLAFSAVLSFFTKAQRHEILAAAAAYCAVLVVFLGNVPGSSTSGS